MKLSKGMYLRLEDDLELSNDYGTYFTIEKGITFIVSEVENDSSCNLTSIKSSSKILHEIWLTNGCIQKHFNRLPVGEEAALRL
jgi:hypothetical protein